MAIQISALALVAVFCLVATASGRSGAEDGSPYVGRVAQFLREEEKALGRIAGRASNGGGGISTGILRGQVSAGGSVSTDGLFHMESEDNGIEAYPPIKNRHVAIVLTGQARDFELTGPSIVKFLLSAYPNPHVFLRATMDEGAFKFHALKEAAPEVTLAAISLFPPRWLPEKPWYPALLGDPYAPAASQGMVQQFALLESLVPLLRSYEQRRGFRFNWIMRVRADSYWYKPPPPLNANNFPPAAHVIPYGSDCRGYNDRMEMGRWRSSRIAFSRLQLLPLIRVINSSLHGLNPEKVLKAGLDHFGIPVERGYFHMCIMSRRVYPTDLLPIGAMTSTAPLNGAKCRPCVPLLTGQAADEKLVNLHFTVSPGPMTSGIDFCDARVPWQEGWEQVFDRYAGADLAAARRTIMEANTATCVKQMEELQSRAAAWDSPAPEVICKRRYLGKAALLGARGESFYTFLDAFPTSDGDEKAKIFVACSFGASLNTGRPCPQPTSWEEAVRSEVGGTDLLAKNVYVRRSHEAMSSSRSYLELTGKAPFGAHALVILLPHYHLTSIINIWAESGAPQVCQLYIAFFPRVGMDPVQNADAVTAFQGRIRRQTSANLQELGFHLGHCVKEWNMPTERCSYFSTKWCPVDVTA